MNGWLERTLTTVDILLKHGAGLSLLLGYVVAIGLTQWIKHTPIYPKNKWAIRSLAAPFGWLTVWFTWPDGFVPVQVKFFIALAVGVSTMWIYKIAAAALIKAWPSLEGKISVTPREPAQ